MDNSRKPQLISGALLVVVLLVAAFAIPASAASSLKVSNCNKAQSRPKTVVLTCADAITEIEKLSWSSFGGKTARGKGTLVENLCEPNCAEDKSIRFPVSIVATGSKKCKGASVYAKFTFTYTSKQPPASVARKWFFTCPKS
jgi:hypothetical protein